MAPDGSVCKGTEFPGMLYPLGNTFPPKKGPKAPLPTKSTADTAEDSQEKSGKTGDEREDGDGHHDTASADDDTSISEEMIKLAKDGAASLLQLLGEDVASQVRDRGQKSLC